MILADTEQVKRLVNDYITKTGKTTFTREEVFDFLYNATPVDAEAVVRCRYCIYADDTVSLCNRKHGLSSIAEDSYCSYGRKINQHIYRVDKVHYNDKIYIVSTVVEDSYYISRLYDVINMDPITIGGLICSYKSGDPRKALAVHESMVENIEEYLANAEEKK